MSPSPDKAACRLPILTLTRELAAPAGAAGGAALLFAKSKKRGCLGGRFFSGKARKEHFSFREKPEKKWFLCSFCFCKKKQKDGFNVTFCGVPPAPKMAPRTVYVTFCGVQKVTKNTPRASALWTPGERFKALYRHAFYRDLSSSYLK